MDFQRVIVDRVNDGRVAIEGVDMVENFKEFLEDWTHWKRTGEMNERGWKKPWKFSPIVGLCYSYTQYLAKTGFALGLHGPIHEHAYYQIGLILDDTLGKHNMIFPFGEDAIVADQRRLEWCEERLAEIALHYKKA